MKLVELLARELKEWPAGAKFYCQDYNRNAYPYKVKPERHEHMDVLWGCKGQLSGVSAAVLSDIASDHATAIVTRSDWSAERARIAKPAKNAEGWIRHRGGKCPVEAGTEVSTRHRDGKIVEVHHMTAYEGASAGSLKCVWSHENDDNDIMAYRLHKPAEQVEACSKPDPRDSAKRDSDYVCWMRDRITEIDATTQALTTERADLVQKLASEGFALIGRAVEPVEDYGNIQIGDLVSVIGIGGFSDCTGLSVGDIVEVTSVDNDESLKTVSGGSWGSIGYNYKFHSRPSA